MLPELTNTEARIIGCLMEKSVVTPDQYPLTLNALTNACNQKSSREPVMALPQNEVQRSARGLRDNTLVEIEENYRNGAEKYKQRLCNTPFNDFQFSAGEYAIITLLLLRGPQTPGELRARSGRLYTFADNEAVAEALVGLLDTATGALVVKLPRTPGRKDAEYMHQLCGEIDIDVYAEKAAAGKSARQGVGVAELQQRITELENEVAELKSQLAAHG